MADPLPGFDDDLVLDAGDDLDDDLDDPELESQSGLGRGLAAIIPTLADLDQPAPRARRGRRRRGLEALITGATPPAEVETEIEAEIDRGPGPEGVDPPVDPAEATAEGAAVEVDRAEGGDRTTDGGAGSHDDADPVTAAGSDLDSGADAAAETGAAPASTAPDHVAVSRQAGDHAPVDEELPSGDPGGADVATGGSPRRDTAGPLPAADPEPATHVPAPSAVRKLRDDLVGALLDGLANTMALDLCAYLHAGPGEEPQLFLQSPSLDAIGPARSFTLLDALRRELEAGRSDAQLGTAGFRGLSVATVGDGSRGLWAVARAEDLTLPEREVATRFCRSFGRAVHQLDGAASPATTLAVPVGVTAHRARDSVLAEVQVRVGDQIRPGHGRAGTRVEAITRAVLVAAGRHVTFRYASEVAHEGEHAAVVLLEGPDHAVSLGSALSPEAGGVATAQAAIRALDGLPH